MKEQNREFIIGRVNLILLKKNEVQEIFNYFISKMLFFISLSTLFLNLLYFINNVFLTYLLDIIIIFITFHILFKQRKSCFFKNYLTLLFFSVFLIKITIFLLFSSSKGIIPFFDNFNFYNEIFIYYMDLINFFVLFLSLFSLFLFYKGFLKDVKTNKYTESIEYCVHKERLDSSINKIIEDKDELKYYNDLLKKVNLIDKEINATKEVFRQVKRYQLKKRLLKKVAFNNENLINKINFLSEKK